MKKVAGRSAVERSDLRKRNELARRMEKPGILAAIQGLQTAANKAYEDGERDFDRPKASGATRSPSDALGFTHRATCREGGIHVEIHPDKSGKPVVRTSLMTDRGRETSCVRLPAQDLLQKGLSGWITIECVPDAPIAQLVQEFEATIRRLKDGWQDLGLPLQEHRGRPKSSSKQARNLVMYLLRIEGRSTEEIASRFGIKARTVRSGICDVQKVLSLPNVGSSEASDLSKQLITCRQCFGNSLKTCPECPVRRLPKVGPSLQGVDGGKMIEEAVSTVFTDIYWRPR